MTLVPAIRTLLDKRSERKNTIDTDAFASSGEKLFNKLSEATSIIPKRIKIFAIALTLATLGTMVGFLTNIVSPLTQLQDFGITTALGIFYAFILVMTLVPAIRTLLDKRSERKNTIDTGINCVFSF